MRRHTHNLRSDPVVFVRLCGFVFVKLCGCVCVVVFVQFYCDCTIVFVWLFLDVVLV